MAQLMLVNPRKRRATKRKTSRTIARRKSPARSRVATVTKTVRRYRRNPIGGGNVMGQIQSAAVGAAGALAVDVAMAKLPIPVAMTANPTMRAATQGIVSVGLGMLVAKFGKKRALGKQLAEGGLVVALHGMGKGLIGPSVGLSGFDSGLLGYQDSGLLGVGAYENLSAYEDVSDVIDDSDDDGMDGVGWYNAAQDAGYDDDF